MANSEVLLLEAVQGLGGEGDTVSVKAGYARNFLFPQKLAIPLSQGNRKQIEALRAAKEKRVLEEFEASKSLAEKIAQVSLTVAVKTGENGKMFGSVTSAEILSLLNEKGYGIEKKHLNIAQPIKELGTHRIEVRLSAEIVAEFNLEIVSENPITESTSDGDHSEGTAVATSDGAVSSEDT